jgi:hypothetical protein
MFPEPLTPTQFIVVLLLVTTVLLFAGYVIVKNWVNSVSKTVDTVEAYDGRIKRLEGHDFHNLRGQVQALMIDTALLKKTTSDYHITNDSRVTRVESTAEATEKTLNDLRVSVANIQTMVADMWNRRNRRLGDPPDTP